MKLNVKSLVEVERAVMVAGEQLKEELKTRLNVNKVVDRIIWGDEQHFKDAHSAWIDKQSGVND